MQIIDLEPITAQEYRFMEFEDDDNSCYELIDGEIMKKSAPTPRHQEISSNLNEKLRNFVKSKKLGKVFYAPIDVFLDEINVPQPDLVFVSTKNAQIITNDGIMGIPDLVVEVISPTSILRDRISKKNIYEKAKIQEYWLVDMQNQEIEIYVLQGNNYQLFNASTIFEGELKSSIFPELKIELKDIFIA